MIDERQILGNYGCERGKSKRLARGIEEIQDFELELAYVKGKDKIADGLTRNEAAATAAPDGEDGEAVDVAAMTTTVKASIEGTTEQDLRQDEYFGPLVKILKDNDLGQHLQ